MAFIYFTQCTEALMHILKVDKGHSSKYHSLHKNAASHSYIYIYIQKCCCSGELKHKTDTTRATNKYQLSLRQTMPHYYGSCILIHASCKMQPKNVSWSKINRMKTSPEFSEASALLNAIELREHDFK